MWVFAASELPTVGPVGPVTVGLIIGALVSVIIFLYRETQKRQDKYDTMQEQRIIEAKETRDGLMEPLEKQTKLIETIYESLLNKSGK